MNIFDAIPEDMNSEKIESIIDNDNVKIERIISRGHTSPDTDWYDQDKNEWVLVLQGAAVLAFHDGTVLNLKAGDYINIAAHKKHRVKWTAPDTETVWLAVHY